MTQLGQSPHPSHPLHPAGSPHQPGAALSASWRTRVTERLQALSPLQRQYALLGAVLSAGVSLLWLVFALSGSSPPPRTAETTIDGKSSVTNIGILPPGGQINPVDQWVGNAGRKLAQYETEREEQGRLNKDRQSFEARTMQRFTELEQRLTSAEQGAGGAARPTSTPPTAGARASGVEPALPQPAVPAVPGDSTSAEGPGQTFPPPAGLPTSRSARPGRAVSGIGPEFVWPPGAPDATTQAPVPVISRVSLGGGARELAARVEGGQSDGPGRIAQSEGINAASAPAPEHGRAQAQTVATFLPVSFTRGTLLGGLDAPTGGQSQANPHPVLIRLSSDSVLPNQFRGEYRECFVIAAGYGDISAERAYLRTESLSCVREDGAALEVRIQGSVYGEDGKVGMRGRLVTKQGQMLANALLAGVVSGIGQGLSTASTSYSTSPLGTIASADSGADAYRAGLGSGVGKALDRLAQYYIKLAENTFPVIEVDAGREVDVVITKGVRIDAPMSGSRGRVPTTAPRHPSPETRYLEVTNDEKF